MYVKKPFLDDANELSPAEKRKLERRHLLYYLRIWDANKDQLLGHLADVSTEGFMLVGEDKIPIEKEFQFEMRLPSIAGDQEAISFTAVSCWSSNDVNQMFFDTGFKFTEISQANVKRISDLIADYGLTS